MEEPAVKCGSGHRAADWGGQWVVGHRVRIASSCLPRSPCRHTQACVQPVGRGSIWVSGGAAGGGQCAPCAKHHAPVVVTAASAAAGGSRAQPAPADHCSRAPGARGPSSSVCRSQRCPALWIVATVRQHAACSIAGPEGCRRRAALNLRRWPGSCSTPPVSTSLLAAAVQCPRRYLQSLETIA